MYSCGGHDPPLLVWLYVLSPVDLCNVVPLNRRDAILRDVTRERDCKIVAQGTQLATLVGQVVDQLRVLAVFARENVLELEDGGINRDTAVALEDLLNCGQLLSVLALQGEVHAQHLLVLKIWSRIIMPSPSQSRVPLAVLSSIFPGAISAFVSGMSVVVEKLRCARRRSVS